jgi:O-6-methylguanine DNA methyltransferase
MKVWYSFLELPTGPAFAAATENGICRLALRFDSRQELIDELRRSFSEEPVEGSPLLGRLARELNEYFSGRLKEFTVPLDVPGTGFQKEVWEHLRKIPFGEVRTYGQLAAEIGNPQAARAVGGAVGSNHAGILIPCHRVVPVSGKAGGFGWGPDVKRRLLAAEGRSEPYL